MTTDLGRRRAAWHRNETEQRAVRARAYNERMAAEEGAAGGWALCPPPCGKAFKPGEKNYRTCWPCSNAQWMSNSLGCVLCGRRHSMSFAVCFSCKQYNKDNEDRAAFLRALVNRRDGFACSMCGDEESGLEVRMIMPPDVGGRSLQWNLETVCVACCGNARNRYGQLDELARSALMEAYAARPLRNFLSGYERSELSRELDELVGAEYETIAFPRGLGGLGVTVDYGTTDERSGLISAYLGFDRPDVETRDEVERAPIPTPPSSAATLALSILQEVAPLKAKECKGHHDLPSGRVRCAGLVDPRVGALCSACLDV